MIHLLTFAQKAAARERTDCPAKQRSEFTGRHVPENHWSSNDMNIYHIDEFADSWFSLLSAHAPVDDLIPYLSATNLEMIFPEETLHNLDDFRKWYAAVGNRYTNQHHDRQQLEVRTDSQDGDLLHVGIVVVWTATNTADGSHIAKRATQAWVVRRNADSEQLKIQKYDVVNMTDVGQDK